jgi:hypothetical protein
MKTVIVIILTAFIFLSSTCKKAIQVPDQELKKIFGKWEWLETSGGFAGKITTPSKAGYSERIEFSNDGVYQKFRNDSLTDKKQFSFSQKTSIQTGKPAWVLSLNEGSNSMAVSFSGQDTLMLNEQVYDGFSYSYVRIK